MKRVTLDQARLAELGDGSEELEVCDADGQPVGYFVPAARYTAIMTERQRVYDWVIKSCPVSEEELKRRGHEANGKGRSTAEILRELAARAAEVK